MTSVSKDWLSPTRLDMAGPHHRYAWNPGRAAVEAFKAGNDVLTMPADLDSSYRAMLEAARSGEISRDRLDASVLVILRAKSSLHLEKDRLVDVVRSTAWWAILKTSRKASASRRLHHAGPQQRPPAAANPEETTRTASSSISVKPASLHCCW